MDTRIRTLIADDEPLALDMLREHAALDCELELVAECRDGASAVEATRKLAPELLLLDVQMPLLDGFEVLSHLALDPAPAVVFVTAHHDYAVQAFGAEAVDYLLKPFDMDRFRRALERAKNQVYRQRAEDGREFHARPAATRASEAGSKPHLDRLLVRDGRRIVAVPVGSIRWIESAGNYLRIHTGGPSYLVRMKISDMEELLDPRVFARVHRTKIVNMTRVESLTPLTNGMYTLMLSDGTEVRMSRLHSGAVLRSFYLGGDRFD